MAKSKSTITKSDLVDQAKAAGIHTQAGLEALRGVVTAGSKNKRLSKSLRKNLKATLPSIEKAQKAAAKQRRKRKVKKARRSLKAQLESLLKP